MTDFKKFNLETVGAPSEPVGVTPSIRRDARTDDVLLLQRIESYWTNMRDFRDRTRRARMYHRGDQLKEVVQTSDGEWMTEEDHITSLGMTPLKQNQIRQLVKNVVGQFLSDTSKSAVISRKREDARTGEMLTNALQYALELNQYRRIDTRAFEEFLLSGAALQKIIYKYMPKLSADEVFISNRPLSNFFVNENIRDVRLHDMDVIGEFFDVTLDKVLAVFAKNDDDIEAIRQMYSGRVDRKTAILSSGETFTPEAVDNLDFYVSVEPHLCRVYEVWQKIIEPRLRCHDWLQGRRYVVTIDQRGEIDEINQQRVEEAVAQGVPADKVPLIEYKERIEEFWYVKYLTPYGEVLYESETIYAHKEHPYSLLLYPLVDGEVWGFVEDVIDQQRYINRLIQLMDFIIGNSAKGVLLVPEEAIPDDMDIDDVADEWSKVNGVIRLRLKHGAQLPKQISSSASIPGVNELLNYQLKFMTDISGVSNSIQGQSGSSGKSGKMYALETQNSSLNTKDYFEAFKFFEKDRNWKVLKTLIQFYDAERHIGLSGKGYSNEALTYDPEAARTAEYDVVMTTSPDSPVFRGVIEESLMTFLSAGLIDMQMYLKNSTLPFADTLLADIANAQQPAQGLAAANAGIQQGLEDQGANAGAVDPQAMGLLQQYMG